MITSCKVFKTVYERGFEPPTVNFFLQNGVIVHTIQYATWKFDVKRNFTQLVRIRRSLADYLPVRVLGVNVVIEKVYRSNNVVVLRF